jgi:hypothetical protein
MGTGIFGFWNEFSKLSSFFCIIMYDYNAVNRIENCDVPRNEGKKLK